MMARKNEWPPLPSAKSRHDFIFFVVDVIDSSRLFARRQQLDEPELKQHDEALNRVHDHVLRSFRLKPGSPYLWHWAGDGGMLAFPTSIVGTIDKVLACAKKVATLHSGGCTHCERHFDLQVRMVLDRGEAYYHPKKGLTRSGALNFASKVRLPSPRTSLVITEVVYKNLNTRTAREFKPIALRDESGNPMYGHVPLMVKAFTKEIVRLSTVDPAQAAHLSYRLGVLQFSEGNRGAAITAFQESMDLLERIVARHRHRYFYRALREFYRLWHRLAEDATDELLHHQDQLAMLQSDEFKNFRPVHELGDEWKLLISMELIIAQLDVLAGNPVNNPIGLTTLEICLLLERVGYPRRWFGQAVHNRLERIKVDMDTDEEGTVDEGCSLCSAAAASCLILNNDEKGAEKLLMWLREHPNENYCWRRIDRFARVPEDNHAFNYAASVLQAFIDNGLDKDDSHVKTLLDLFLAEAPRKPGQFPERWTQHLTQTIYDFSTYIFPALARYRLAGGEFDTEDSGAVREGVVKEALRALADRLRHDALEARLEDQVGRTYAARENVGSLALGQLLEDFPDADEIIAYNLRRVAEYVRPDVLSTIRTRTIDSSLDRMRKMLDGWLLQIEAALYRRQQGWSIPAFVSETLGIKAEPPQPVTQP